MVKKITALMLLATALPSLPAWAHSVSKTDAPVTAYLFLMLGIGAVYGIFLLLRTQRRNDDLN